jgi:hypothetical protein
VESTARPIDAPNLSSSSWRTRFVAAPQALRWPVLVYLGSRALVLALAALEGVAHHHAVLHELANWDGKWYVTLASAGYPTRVSRVASTFGFFPLYPLVVHELASVLAHVGFTNNPTWLTELSGVIVSGIGGLVSAVLVQRLASGWWGEAAGRRAVALFCLFPGSVVFSMVYAEGLMLPLVAGCILALQRRRWLVAGTLAGLATATEPQGLVLIAVCCGSALCEFRRLGLGSRVAWRSLVAPTLSVTGVAAFASFLWARTGTPFATLIVQDHAWHQGFDPLALARLAHRLAQQIGSSDEFRNLLNPIAALTGVAVLAVLLGLMFRRRRSLSIEAWIWTVGITLIAVCTEHLPPTSRMLITAFPAVLVIATYLEGRWFWLLQSVNVLLLVTTAWLTFIFPRVLPP